MSKQLEVAFIGGGLSSAVGMTHFSACEMDGRFKLKAGAFSRNHEVNQETGNLWNVPVDKIYDDWKTLVDQEKDNLDAFIVLTHSPQHHEALDYILSHTNTPIICEKSMVMDVEQAQDLYQKHQEKIDKGFIVTTYNYTGYPMLRELREMVFAGELGEIKQIHLEMPQEGLIRPPAIAGKAAPPQSWRLSDGNVPTICLDLGVHMQNMAWFLLEQEPSEVMADFNSYSEYDVFDYIQIMMRYPNGRKGTMWMTKTAIGNRNGLKVRIFGDKGSATWVQMEPEELKVNYLNGQKLVLDRGAPCKVAGLNRYNRMKAGHPSGFVEAFANHYFDIADALLEFKEKGSFSNKYVFNFFNAKNSIQLFDAATKSHHSQNWTDTQLESPKS